MFKVTMSDGTTHALDYLTIKDRVGFERKYGVAFSVLFTDSREEWWAYAIWLGLRRKNVNVPADFEAFLDQTEDILIGEDTDPGNSQGEATPATSN